jgi:hypothetical protein
MNRLQKACTLLVGVCIISVISVPNVAAISANSKPSQPKIVSVAAMQGSSKGKVNILVNFVSASTSSKSPVLLTEIRVGGFTCSAKKSATKCTVKNVPVGKKLVITARAKNRIGFGKYTGKISYSVFVGSRWTAPSVASSVPSAPGSDPSAVSSIPSAVSSVPSAVSSVPSAVSSTPVTSYTPFVSNVDPAAAVSPATTLQFDLTGAIGLALKSTVSSTSVKKSALGSNLVVVLESGLTREALSAGTASISKFIIAPNNRLYVLFNSATNFGSSTCLLAQVYRATGKAVCLESSSMSIELSSKNAIQFDASGNIFYAGTRNGAKVLRRFSNGVSADYVNQYQSFGNWLVLPNGDVLISGYTSANGLSWTRKISSGGSVSSLASTSSDWMLMFPDGNAYFSHGGSENCIKRYLVQNQMLDPIPWAGFVSQCKPATNSENILGVFLNSFWMTANAQVLARYTSKDLYYLYPTVRKANQPLSQITYGIPALTSMVLVGTNTNGTNQMVLFDSSTNTSSLLADGSNEIEFYHVQLNLAQNRIYFDGLRFSDNKYVIGYLDLSTRAILASDLLARVQDFQTFVG